MHFCKSNKINQLIFRLHPIFAHFWLLAKVLKKGNSNTKERIELIDQFLAIFGSYKIQYLTADREFIGEAWFKYLIHHRIEFRLRIGLRGQG